MVIDMDNFKPLNDMHGHVAGDLLLVEVANRLLCVVRQTDTVARYGGDEFVVMLSELSADPSDSLKLAGDVAHKICRELAQPYRLTFDASEGSHSMMVVDYQCSASVGVVLFMDSDASQVETMARADAAMYEAKAAGRNQVRFSPLGFA